MEMGLPTGLFDGFPLLAGHFTIDGQALYLNEHWTHFTGHPNSHLMAKGWLDVVHADDHDIFSSKHMVHDAERPIRIQGKDGKYRWHLLKTMHKGEILSVVAMDADFTMRTKFAQEKIATELERTLDQIPAMIWRTRPDGYLDYANKRWLDFWGQTLTDAQGWGWRDGVHPDDRDGIEAFWRLLVAERRDGSYEVRVGNPERGYRWCLSIGTPFLDDSGELVAWYGAVFDIEVRKQAEQALRVSESYLAAGQKLSKVGSFGLDLTSQWLYWSDETFQILEYGTDLSPSIELFKERVHPDDLGLVDQLQAKFAQGVAVVESEFRLLFRDGRNKHVRILGQRDLDKTSYTAVLMDNSLEVQNSKNLKKAQSDIAHVSRISTVGELTASIAHEVNQPLAAVITRAESTLRWIERDPPDIEKTRTNLLRIIADADRACDVIRRVRRLCQKGTEEISEIDISELLLESRSYVEGHAHRVDAQIKLDVDPGLPSLHGDRIQLQQVLINLMVNSLQALASSERADRWIKVTVKGDMDRVEIRCLDNGPGIPHDGLEAIFEPFHSTKKEGMGIGLSICRSIVELHGGKITAHNSEGFGALFSLTLPMMPDKIASAHER